MKKEKNVPQCIGVVMDGNRRWAKEQGFPTLEGHRAGYKKLKEAVDWAQEVGISFLIFYGFSTENWNRPAEEVDYLMGLLLHAFRADFSSFKEKEIRVKVIGEKERLSEDIQKAIVAVEKETEHFSNFTLVLAISYGGRGEIISAVKNLMKKYKDPSHITEENFKDCLWTAGMPDPDLMIRTGGRNRLSNFLLWQSAYTELFFLPTYWPDFSKEEFLGVLEAYTKIRRTQGR